MFGKFPTKNPHSVENFSSIAQFAFKKLAAPNACTRSMTFVRDFIFTLYLRTLPCSRFGGEARPARGDMWRTFYK